MTSEGEQLVCPGCGQAHKRPALRVGFSAVCVRCGATLERRLWLGEDSPLALALAGLLLFLPAVWLPIVTVGKFGNNRVSRLFDGVEGLWRFDMRALGILVFLCCAIAPLVLLLLIMTVMLRRRFACAPARGAQLERIAHVVQSWSMPEVQVLAVLVSFFKLGDVVEAAIGPGLWFYAAMAAAMLLAWRGFSGQPGAMRASTPRTSQAIP
ncbi:MAG TPA: paraquat-inducible protein A [Opitutaceae bacterium]